MRLGFIESSRRGATDLLLTELAEALRAQGKRVVGVVQSNTECADQRLCDMDVQVLPDGSQIRISQNLGPEARGCRLDPEALEQAVAELMPLVDARADLLIINKFGKHEASGRGFRDVIGRALELGLPVVVGVNATNRAAFETFAEGCAEAIPAELDAMQAWCNTA